MTNLVPVIKYTPAVLVLATNWISLGVFHSNSGEQWHVSQCQLMTNVIATMQTEGQIFQGQFASYPGPTNDVLLFSPIVSSGTHSNPPPLPFQTRFRYESNSAPVSPHR